MTYERPLAGYTSSSTTTNATKYQDDANAVPKRAVSSEKVDGDFNFVIDALNELADAAITGSLPGQTGNANKVIVTDGTDATWQLLSSSNLSTNGVSAGTYALANVTVDSKGLVTSVTAGQVGTAQIVDSAVSNAKIRDSVGLSVIGRSTNSTGAVADITAANDGDVLRRNGTSVGFSALPAASTTNQGVVELATTAELQTGTDSDRAVTPAAMKGALGISKFFESTEQAMNPSALVSVAHGFGSAPKAMNVVLRCKTTDGGYSPGDELYYSSHDAPGQCQISLGADATYLFVMHAGTIRISGKGTGSVVNITNANWRWVLRGWA